MEGPLAGCYEKLSRAKEHLDLLRIEAERFAGDSYGFTHEFNPKSKRYTIRASVPPGPPRLGVLIGDVVHNLRSCLDHLVWQLVTANGETPKSGSGGNQFPILTWKPTKPSFRQRAAKGDLRGVDPLAIKMIEHLQPYRVGPRRHKHNLAILQALSNTDKHQLVLPTCVWLGGKEPAKVNLKPNRAAGLVVKPKLKHGALRDNTKVVTMLLPAAGPKPYVELEGETTMTVALDNGLPVVEALRDILVEIAQNCAVFEGTFF